MANGDLISREALLRAMCKTCTMQEVCEKSYSETRDFIQDIPAVDAEPVRHGYWKDRGNNLECSECGCEYTKYDWEGSVIAYYWCPNCGAKMHVERDG